VQCDNNQITSLDNLPQTLEILNCSYNKMTRLDNFPITLKELQCDNNQFIYNFKPTLENIRNYNDSKLKI
jgi:Leucine-rich repeat (LRR) protein